MFIIFTGNGKGKTTAAIGQAMRAVGNGSTVLMVQFIKGPWESGEDKLFKSHDLHFTIVKKGKGFVGTPCDKLPFEKHVKAAHDALVYSSKEAKKKVWSIIILDEVWVALGLKLITEAEIDEFLATSKDLCQHVIMTGRGCPSNYIERADLVTEMKEIKHPFASGLMAVKNVEY